MTTPVRPCPLCGSTEAWLFLDSEVRSAAGESYTISQCSGCGLRYTQPLPSTEELAGLYRQEYYGATKPGWLSWDSLRLLLHRSVLWQRRRALLGRPPGRILDVGCGDGDFLASLKRCGWDVYGTEFSRAACDLTRARGIRVHQGELRAASFPSGFFDVVTYWHVLEHIPEPRLELAEAQRILRDDGVLVVEVPNSASLTLRLCRTRWLPLGVPGHLQHFTPGTLERLLRQVGFVPIHEQSFHHLDFVLSFMSFMNRLDILPRGGSHYFVSDYRRAATLSKLLFLALGLPVGLFSFPYSVLTTILTGNSETVTITARKAVP